MKQISYTWLKKYEAWYLSNTNNGKRNSANGLNVNMCTLCALLNRAVKRNLLSKVHYM